MNAIRKTFVALLLILVFPGCNETNPGATSTGARTQEAILRDSLQKLDSLVLNYRSTKTTESNKYAKQAVKLAQAMNTPEARAKAYNICGNACIGTGTDSGFYYYHQALMVIDSFHLADKKGKVLYNLGMLHRSKGNYERYVRLVDSAFRFSSSVNDYATVSNSLNALGNIYFNLGKKANARQKYDSAFAVATRNLLYPQMGSALGNLAKFEPDTKKAVTLQRRAISYLEKGSGTGEPIALSLINIGYRQSDPDSAIHYFKASISLVSVEFAPEVIIGAYNNMAYCYLAKGDLTTAEKCIREHAIPVAEKTNNVDWQSTVYDTYADILRRKGDPTNSMIYQKKALEAKNAYNAMIRTVVFPE